MIASQNTSLHPTAVKVLRAVQATEEHATNHVEWIAEEIAASDSTVRRWLRLLYDAGMVEPYEQDWIWGDPHKYWTLTHRGEEAIGG